MAIVRAVVYYTYTHAYSAGIKYRYCTYMQTYNVFINFVKQRTCILVFITYTTAQKGKRRKEFVRGTATATDSRRMKNLVIYLVLAGAYVETGGKNITYFVPLWPILDLII